MNAFSKLVSFTFSNNSFNEYINTPYVLFVKVPLRFLGSNELYIKLFSTSSLLSTL